MKTDTGSRLSAALRAASAATARAFSAMTAASRAEASASNFGCSFGGCPLRLELGGPGGCLGFSILSLRLCLLGRPCGGDGAIGSGQLRLGSELQIFRHAHH